MNEAVCPKSVNWNGGNNGAEVRRLFRAAKVPLRLLARLGLGGLRPLRDYNYNNNQGVDHDFGAFRYDFESTGDMLVKYHLFSWELGS